MRASQSGIGRATQRLTAVCVVVLLAAAAWTTSASAREPDLEDERVRVLEELARTRDALDGASRGSPSHFRAKEQHDRLVQDAVTIDELLWTEQVFRDATPGSPAQFRARESADALRLRLAGVASSTG